jgi:hypothetical protein
MRSDLAAKERNDRLHQLQLQERGILLRILTEQVEELRSQLYRQSSVQKYENNKGKILVRALKDRSYADKKVNDILHDAILVPVLLCVHFSAGIEK